MKREDVLNVDVLRQDMLGAFEEFQRTMRAVFGDVVHALDTVIDRHNTLDARLSEQQRQFDTVSARLLAIEKRLGGPQ